MSPADARRVAAAAYPGLLGETVLTALVVDRSQRAGLEHIVWLEAFNAVRTEVAGATSRLSEEKHVLMAWETAGFSLGLAAACLVLLDQVPPAMDEDIAWVLMAPLHALYSTGETILSSTALDV